MRLVESCSGSRLEHRGGSGCFAPHAARRANPDKREMDRAQDRARHAANPEKARGRDRAHRAANLEKLRERVREWGAANSDKIAQNASKRRARKRNAAVELTPAEREEMRLIYAEAQRKGWHVDHIKALAKGGLHHPDNLVAIPPVMNMQKHTQYWPELHALQ